MSHLTCTSTPGRNGHLGGLFGISGADGLDADVSAAVCADRTLFGRGTTKRISNWEFLFNQKFSFSEFFAFDFWGNLEEQQAKTKKKEEKKTK